MSSNKKTEKTLDEKIRELHLKNLGYSEIASRLSTIREKITRNCVAGRIHRMKKRGEISSGAVIRKHTTKRKIIMKPAKLGIKPTPKNQEKTQEKKATKSSTPEVVGLFLPLLEVSSRGCKFAVKEEPTRNFLFCGLPCSSETSSWCDHHNKMCHTVSRHKQEEKFNG